MRTSLLPSLLRRPARWLAVASFSRARARLSFVFLALGTVASLSALPSAVTVTEATQLEVMRGEIVSIRAPLSVGTRLDVINLSGDYLLVRHRLTNGRVRASATDFVARANHPAPGDPADYGPLPVEAVVTPTPATQTNPAGARVTTGANSTGKKSATGASDPARANAFANPSAPADANAVADPAADASAEKFGVGVLVAVLALGLLLLIANWRVYTKAGQPGWATIVPIYNFIVLLQIAGKPVWWIVLCFIPVVNLVIMVLIFLGLAENFGRSLLFGFGLLLLPMIFLPWLAFGGARYERA